MLQATTLEMLTLESVALNESNILLIRLAETPYVPVSNSQFLRFGQRISTCRSFLYVIERYKKP